MPSKPGAAVLGGLLLTSLAATSCSSSSPVVPSTKPVSDSVVVACESNVKLVQTAAEAFQALNSKWAPDLQSLVRAGLMHELPHSRYYTITYTPQVGRVEPSVSGVVTATGKPCG